MRNQRKMSSEVDSSLLPNLTLQQLRDKARKLGISFPARIHKQKLVDLILTQAAKLPQSQNPPAISSPEALILPNLSNSNPQSPAKSNNSPKSIINIETAENISQTPKIRLPSLLQEYQKEKELSPLFPLLAPNHNRKVQINSNAKSQSSNTTTSQQRSIPQIFKCQHPLLIGLVSIFCLFILTLISGIFFGNLNLLILSFIQFIIALFSAIFLYSDIKEKSQILASKSIKYMAKESRIKIQRFDIQNKFDADWVVMRETEKLLVERKKIRVIKEHSQKVWILIQ